MMRRLFFFILLFHFTIVYGQQRRGIQHFGVEEGLSQGSTFDITQDSSGFIWIATADGLDRFDGKTFKIFKSDLKDSTALQSSMFRNLLISGNNLWISTIGTRALYRMDLATGKIERTTEFASTFSRAMVYPFCEEGDTLWLLARDNGIVQLNWKTKKVLQRFAEADDFFPSTGFTSFDSARRMLWYVSDADSELCSFSLKSHQITHHRFFDHADNSIIVLHAIAVDHQHDILIGYKGGLMRFDPETDSLVKYTISRAEGPLTSESVISLLETRQGEVWCGTDSGSVYSLEAGSSQFVKRCEPDNSVSGFKYRIVKFYLDKTENLWVGTDPDGLYKIDLKAKPFHHTFCDTKNKRGLKSNFIKCFLESGDEIYIGTYDQGINVLNEKDGTYRYISGFKNSSPENPAISCMLVEPDGRIVVGTTDGVGIIEKGSSTLSRPLINGNTGNFLSVIYSMARLPDGSLIVGATHGLSELKKTKEGYDFIVLPVRDEVFKVLIDDQGGLWLASAAGVYFSKNASDLTDLKLVVKDVERVKCITEGDASTMWVGTINAMLRIDRNTCTVIKEYNEEDGMPDNFVYGIVPDGNGNFWISTNRGLSRFDPVTGVFRNYTVSDGLQSNEFNTGAYYINQDNELFFGGVNGFNHFFASEIKDNPFTPACVLTGLKIFDKPYSSDTLIERMRSITLDYTNTNLLFEYTALEFSDASKNKFRYRLLGLDSNWVDAGTERSARFVNLDPGDYNFQLKASNNDGIWSNHPLELHITITPPFWRTWTFIIFMSVVITLLLAGGIRFYSARQLKLRTRELELKQSARMNAIIETEEKERKRIAGELHDGLGQLLSTARLNVAGLEETPDERDVILLKNSIQLLDQACEEVRTISHNMMPGALIRLGLTSAVNELVNKINDTEKLKIEYDTDFEERLPETTEIALYRIIQEVLNNMVRHAEAKNILVKMQARKNTLDITIGDDGKSFDVAGIAGSKGLGWKNIYSRVELLNGTIHVESEKGKGTSISISIPLNP